MITDPLTPVFGEAGVGTVVTMSDRAVLGQGLEFNRIFVESYAENTAEQYRLLLIKTRVLFVSPKTLVFTDSGFLTPTQLIQRKGAIKIRSLQFRCLVCHRWYLPNKPVWAYCSMTCTKIGNIAAPRRSVNKNTIPICAKEDWITLGAVHRVRFTEGTEAVRITKMETGHSLYANNILISSSHLL